MASQVNTSLTRVFFSAALTHGLSGSAQVVVYDHVWSNLGDAYDSSTGVFTCKLAGYYSFITNVESQKDKHVALSLQLNNKDVYQLFSTYITGYQSATNSAILKLNQGDTVRVYNNGYEVHSSSRLE